MSNEHEPTDPNATPEDDGGAAEAAALLRDAAVFQDAHLRPLLESTADHNPAAVIYALLDGAMQVAKVYFPDHTESLYASATQMVFEAHYGSDN